MEDHEVIVSLVIVRPDFSSISPSFDVRLHGSLSSSTASFVERSLLRPSPPDPYFWKLQTFQPLSHANLEVLKTSPEKPGDWDLKPGDFQNMCQIIKKALFV